MSPGAHKDAVDDDNATAQVKVTAEDDLDPTRAAIRALGTIRLQETYCLCSA